MHNHIWRSEIKWTENGPIFHGEPENPTDIGFGDTKFRNSVNFEARKSKILGLNVFPTKIGREDASIVLKEVYKALCLIESNDKQLCYISHYPIQYVGNSMQFSEFIDLMTL